MQVNLVAMSANFRSRVATCTRIVELFKHLLHATAHPHFLVLELQVLMGAFPGQYDICYTIYHSKEVYMVNICMYCQRPKSEEVSSR